MQTNDQILIILYILLFVLWDIGWMFTLDFDSPGKETLRQNLKRMVAYAFLWPMFLGMRVAKDVREALDYLKDIRDVAKRIDGCIATRRHDNHVRTGNWNDTWVDYP